MTKLQSCWQTGKDGTWRGEICFQRRPASSAQSKTHIRSHSTGASNKISGMNLPESAVPSAVSRNSGRAQTRIRSESSGMIRSYDGSRRRFFLGYASSPQSAQAFPVIRHELEPARDLAAGDLH